MQYGWHDAPSTAFRVFFEWQIPSILTVTVSMRVLAEFPRCITARTLNGGHALVLAFVFFTECVGLEDSRYQDCEIKYFIAFMASGRFVLLVVAGDIPFALGINVLYTVGVLLFASIRASLTYDSALVVVSSLVIYESMGLLIYSWQFADARATLEAQASTLAETVTVRLLSTVCDAVVHLDSGSHICRPTPKLASLLLHCSGKPLDGTRFRDLLCEHDVERFSQYLEARSGPMVGDSIASGLLHVDLRDIFGSPFPVQIFHQSFYDLDNRLSHIIGVKEDDKETRHQSVDMPMELDSGTAAGFMGASFPCHNTGSYHDYESIPEHLTVSSYVSDTSTVVRDDVGGVVAWVDVSRDGFPVLQHSSGFIALWGGCSSPCLQLLPWVDRQLREGFAEFARTVHRSSFEGARCANVTKVEMRPPHLRRFRVRLDVSVKCSVPFRGPECGEFPSDADVVRFVFRDINWRSCPRLSQSAEKRSRRGRRRSPEAEDACSVDVSLPAVAAEKSYSPPAMIDAGTERDHGAQNTVVYVDL